MCVLLKAIGERILGMLYAKRASPNYFQRQHKVSVPLLEPTFDQAASITPKTRDRYDQTNCLNVYAAQTGRSLHFFKAVASFCRGDTDELLLREAGEIKVKIAMAN